MELATEGSEETLAPQFRPQSSVCGTEVPPQCGTATVPRTPRSETAATKKGTLFVLVLLCSMGSTDVFQLKNIG